MLNFDATTGAAMTTPAFDTSKVDNPDLIFPKVYQSGITTEVVNQADNSMPVTAQISDSESGVAGLYVGDVVNSSISVMDSGKSVSITYVYQAKAEDAPGQPVTISINYGTS